MSASSILACLFAAAMSAASATSLAFAMRSDVVPDDYHETAFWLQSVSTYLEQLQLLWGNRSAELQVVGELLVRVSNFSKPVLSMPLL